MLYFKNNQFISISKQNKCLKKWDFSFLMRPLIYQVFNTTEKIN
jgi:hypothetical protein